MEAGLLDLTELPVAERKSDYQSELAELRGKLEQELAKRPYNNFNGVAPFRQDLRYEFQRSHNLHFTQSQFCSGERQQILKYMFEHPRGGLDILGSTTTDYKHESKQFKKSGLLELVDESTVWQGAESADGEPGQDDEEATAAAANVGETARERTQRAMVYIAEAVLADEVRDKGFRVGPDEKKQRMEELLKMSAHELRSVCRTWPVVEACFPLHDAFELEHLIKNWATLRIFAKACKRSNHSEKYDPKKSLVEAHHDDNTLLHVRGVLDRSETELMNILAEYSTQPGEQQPVDAGHAVLQAIIRKRFDAISGENTSWALAAMCTAVAADTVISRSSELPRPLSVTRHLADFVKEGSESGSISGSRAAAIEAAAKLADLMPTLEDFIDLHEAVSAQPIEEVRARPRHWLSAACTPRRFLLTMGVALLNRFATTLESSWPCTSPSSDATQKH